MREQARAETLLARGLLDSAARETRRLLARRPDEPGLRELEGRVLRRMRRLPQAARAFARAQALARGPAALSAALKRAEALASAGRAAAAEAVLRAALDASPRPASVAGWLDRYIAALYASRFDEARRAGEAVLSATRDYTPLRRLTWASLDHELRNEPHPPALTGRVLARLKRWRGRGPWKAYWTLYFGLELERPVEPASLAAVAPRYRWMRYQAGKALFFRGDFAGAEREFTAAAATSRPANWRALAFRAEARWCQGRLPAALADLRASERAVVDEDWIGMRIWAAEILLWAGMTERALDLLQEASRSGRSEALCWEGAALCLAGRPAAGLKKLEAALALEPRRGDALLWRAEALLRLGRLKPAAAAAETAARHYAERADSPNFYARALRGLIRARRGDAAGARRDWESLPAPVRRAAGSLENLFALSKGLRSQLRAPAWLTMVNTKPPST